MLHKVEGIQVMINVKEYNIACVATLLVSCPLRLVECVMPEMAVEYRRVLACVFRTSKYRIIMDAVHPITQTQRGP